MSLSYSQEWLSLRALAVPSLNIERAFGAYATVLWIENIRIRKTLFLLIGSDGRIAGRKSSEAKNSVSGKAMVDEFDQTNI